MGIMQDKMQEAYFEEACKRIVELIVDRCAEADISLTDYEGEQLLCAIGEGWLGDWVMDLEQSHDGAAIRFTEADGDAIRSELKRISENMFGKDAINKIRDNAVNDFYKNWQLVAVDRDKDAQKFCSEIHSLWCQAFERLEMMRFVLLTYGEQGICDVERKIKDGVASQTPMLELAIRFLSRACQLLGEIIVLLRHGFAEGALARWRSLHELDVTLTFIDQHGGDTAERYLAHDVAESRKALNQYDDTFGRHNDMPVPEAVRQSIEAECQQVCDKYGEEFKNDYGWASRAMNIKKPTFNQIEKDVGLEHFRGQYSLASHGIHAKTKSITFRPSQPTYTDDAIAGGSVYGLHEPIANASATAYHFYTIVAKQWPSFDSLVAIEILKRLYEEIIRIVGDVEDALNRPQASADGDDEVMLRRCR